MKPEEQKLIKGIANKRKEIAPDRMDISFNELMNMHQDDELIIKPEYQRFFRWSDIQKTTLIESILLSIPIPPIFVAEDADTGKWELVDGLQRVSTILSFFGKLKDNLTCIPDEQDIDIDVATDLDYSTVNKWTLSTGRLLPELEGFNIDTLPTSLIINIKRASCRVEILRGSSSHDMKYELFRRLNSGGSQLTAQEVRNAIFRGASSTVNDLLSLAVNDFCFKSLTDLNQSKKKELFDQELALRFFAFYDDVENINQNTENYLNDYMDNASRNSEYPKDENLEIFKKTFALLFRLDDLKIFRNSRGLFVPAWFEGIAISVTKNIAKYENDIELLRSKIEALKQDGEFKRLSGSASNSRSRVKKRLQRALVIFSE